MKLQTWILSVFLCVGFVICAYAQDTTQTYTDQNSDIDETEPQFYKGDLDNSNFEKYILSQIKVPQVDVDNEVKGVMEIRFVISKHGELEDIMIYKGLSTTLDSEVLRVFKNTPSFYAPGTYEGRAVSLASVMRIEFPLK